MLFPSPEYRTIIGTDEVLERCIEEEFPDFKSQWEILQGVEKADAGRYCLLYKHGGIYADLDYEVRRNFYQELHANGGGGKVHLLEGCFTETRPEDGPIALNIQNAMMASPARHPFWERVFESMKQGRYAHSWNDPHGTGPRMLSIEASKHASEVLALPCANYQRNDRCGNFMELEPQAGIHWNQASWMPGVKHFWNFDFIHSGFANAHPDLGDVGLKQAMPEDLAKVPQLALLLNLHP